MFKSVKTNLCNWICYEGLNHNKSGSFCLDVIVLLWREVKRNEMCKANDS